MEVGIIRGKVAYIDVSFLAHATEDQEKVLAAVKKLFPVAYAERISFSRDKLTGEYGNPIIFFKTQIREPEITETLLLNISANLPVGDKEYLSKNLDLHVDGSSLYIRLDKQEAYRGRFKLCQADPIRIHIKFKRSGIEDIRKVCQSIGLIL